MIKYAGYFAIFMMLAVSGCEVDNTSTDSSTAYDPVVESSGTNDSSSADSGGTVDGGGTNAPADQAEWDSIVWYTARGPSGKGAVKVMSLTANIESSGNSVRFTWDQYPFGNSWAVGHFFVLENGVYKGGKFEWIRNPGQGIKLLGNIKAGYNGLKAPAPGTPVAFAWTSSDGKKRSNLAKTVWR